MLVCERSKVPLLKRGEASGSHSYNAVIANMTQLSEQ